MARPTVLNLDVQRAICETIAAAGTLEDAATRAGIHVNTVLEWMRRGRAEESGTYRDFHDAVLKARTERRLGLEATIRKHAVDDWHAAAWLLERTEPKRYAQRVRVHVEEQLTDAVTRLTRALADRPDVLDLALSALTGTDSDEGVGEDSGGADRENAEGGKTVQPSPAP